MFSCFQVQNGATFVKVDKVDIMKDNSPALLFQGMVHLFVLISASRMVACGFMLDNLIGNTKLKIDVFL